MLGNVSKQKGGSWIFQFAHSTAPNHVYKRFTAAEYGSSEKAKAAALKFQKEIQPKLVSKIGTSNFDKIFKKTKAFRDYTNLSEEQFLKKPPAEKRNLYKKYKNSLKYPLKAGYNTSASALAKLLGIDQNVLTSYTGKSTSGIAKAGYANSSKDFVKKNFPFIQRPDDKTGGLKNFYKNPSEKILTQWDDLQKASIISEPVKNNVQEINKIFRNEIVNKKKLPDLLDVLEKTNIGTPSKAAGAMAVYSRALRGEEFKKDLGIKINKSAGERLITQLGEDTKTNSYRNAFYKLALNNVDQQFNKNGTLGQFKKTFAKELRAAMRLKTGQTIPFNVNEVISLSAGESRSIQPFSVFVDATSSKINSGLLMGYQSAFSKRVGEVQDFLSQGKKADAKAAANKLLETQKGTIKKLMDDGLTRSQINQLNFPEIKIGKNVLDTYDPKDLSRYKKAGLDIGQFAKDKGFYIDVKKAKPFWESNVKNTLVAAAKNNTGNVCNIFAGRVAFSKDGGRIGFSGGCAKEMAEAMETDRVGTLNKVSQTEGILPKFKSAALGFLKNPGIRRFGIAGVAGTVGAAIVKEFNNNDPTTYLSNEDQQKNMLVSMVTDPITTEFDRPDILDYQLPAAGATIAGSAALAAPSTIQAGKSRALGVELKRQRPGVVKTGARLLGRGLGVASSPGLLAPLTALDVTRQVSEGDSPLDIATNPMNYVPALFAEQTPRLTRGLNPTLRKVASLGLGRAGLGVLSRAGIVGLGLSLGIQGMNLLDD